MSTCWPHLTLRGDTGMCGAMRMTRCCRKAGISRGLGAGEIETQRRAGRDRLPAERRKDFADGGKRRWRRAEVYFNTSLYDYQSPGRRRGYQATGVR